jgi:hypothetical protein
MLIGNIVNIVQHGHLYNSFLLIIVACIVILLELYYIGIMLASASSLHFHQSTGWKGMKPNWDRIDARLVHQIFSWNFDVILSLYIGLCRCVLDTCI